MTNGEAVALIMHVALERKPTPQEVGLVATVLSLMADLEADAEYDGQLATTTLPNGVTVVGKLAEGARP